MDIFINRAGSQLGPFEQRQVEEMLTNGELSGSDMIWCEGLSNWIPLSTVIIGDQPRGQPQVDLREDLYAAIGGSVIASALMKQNPFRGIGEPAAPPTNVPPLLHGEEVDPLEPPSDESENAEALEASVAPDDVLEPPFLDDEPTLEEEQVFQSEMAEPEIFDELDFDGIDDIDIDLDF